jgi:hypothetical protein
MLARWADPETGKIVVWDRRARTFTEVDPARHATVEDFNLIPTPEGGADAWFETELLAGLEDSAARFFRQLENVQPPPSHIRRMQKQHWHFNHVLPPKSTVGLALFVAAQMVRSPVWREAINRNTLAHIEKTTKEKIEADLALASEEEEIARLENLLSLRYVAAETPKKMLIELSGHLVYKIGVLLCHRFFWSVHRFSEPLLALGNEPVGLVNGNDSPQTGSLAQLARGRGVLSVNRPLEQLVEEVVEIVNSSQQIIMPFGPRHAIVLAAIEQVSTPRPL